ncbi:MAG TPA: low temperature requirement protein A [Actinomycetota bacterium]|nr:low temperature requirement protein A [Actinomycetota bacterium]
MSVRARLFRPATMRDFDAEDRRVTWLELFFDLIFVAAVASLADGLAHHPTLEGLWHFVALFVPVWWAWMAFTWFATAWDNDDVFHRVAMLIGMLLGIVLAAGIPRVLEGNDRLFVTAYAAMMLLLVAMFARVVPHAGEARGLAVTYLVTDLLGAAIWLASLLVGQPGRYWVWVVAMLVLLTGPIFAVRAYSGQPYDERHIPERYGLFTIIVLGEGVLAVSATLADVNLNVRAIVTGVLGFGLAAAIWWTYFETMTAAALSRERLGAAFLWGYGQFFAFSGIAAAAVGVELAIVDAAKERGLDVAARLAICGGPAAFLFALAAIHRVTEDRSDRVLVERAIAIALLIGIALIGEGLGPVALVGAVLLVFLITAALDIRHTAHRPGMQTEAAPSDDVGATDGSQPIDGRSPLG